MAEQSDVVTIREFYIGLDSIKKDIMQPITNLAARFDALESGRLSAAEKDIANMKGRMMYVPILISSAVSIFSIFVSIILFISKK